MDRASKIALGVLAVIAIIAATSDADAKRKKVKGKLPTGPKVEVTQTGGHDPKAWALTRFAAALAAVKLTETDATTAQQIALSILTHWSIETGSGAGEWNNNPGNINASGAQSYTLIRDVDGTYHPQRSFDTIDDGARAYVDLLNATRYKQALYVLANNPTSSDWYITLGKAGWFDPTKAKVTPPLTWDDARKAYEARRTTLAAIVTPPSTSGQTMTEAAPPDDGSPVTTGDDVEVVDDLDAPDDDDDEGDAP
jgi:hypothetical protein